MGVNDPNLPPNDGDPRWLLIAATLVVIVLTTLLVIQTLKG